MLFQFLFALEMFVIALIFFVILMQKSSEDGFISKNNFSGPLGRGDLMTSFTYFLIFAFFFNTLLLNVVYQKEYKASVVQNIK